MEEEKVVKTKKKFSKTKNNLIVATVFFILLTGFLIYRRIKETDDTTSYIPALILFPIATICLFISAILVK